jgi:hypothetical protein
MQGMKNMSSMGLLWMQQWSSQIRKRRIIHSKSAQHNLLCCETWRSHTGVEDYDLSTGDVLEMFEWNVVPSSCSVHPQNEDKLTNRQGTTSHMTWIFTNTTVRISKPPTVVLKYQQETTNQRCIDPKRNNISFTPHSKPDITQLWKSHIFCYQHAKRM